MIRLIIAALLMVTPSGTKAQEPVSTYMNQAPHTNMEQLQTVYMLSGLGADYRAFQNLDLQQYKVVHVNWIPPQKSESMAHYASRIKSQITTPNPAIIGLSFGGMVAVELAKQMPVQKLVLISSAKTKKDLAGGNFLFLKLKLYKIIPGYFLKRPNFIVHNLFGTSSKKDKKILAEILRDSDPHFFRWAMGNIASWDNETIPPHLIHIHGTADKIMPYGAADADYRIKDGGHLMVLNRADTINKIILDYLKK